MNELLEKALNALGDAVLIEANGFHTNLVNLEDAHNIIVTLYNEILMLQNNKQD